MRTLAQLAAERSETETKISGALGATAHSGTDMERAEFADVLAALHDRLADIFADAERVAAKDPALWDLGVPQGFRWAITGATHGADWHRRSAADYRELAATSALARRHDVIAASKVRHL